MEDIAVTVWQTTLDGMPLKVTEWVNNKGDVVQMVIDSGAGKIEGASPPRLPDSKFVRGRECSDKDDHVCVRARAHVGV